ncbi:hypothetical protein ABTK15_19895, partial [Acinetobacter baumannii]
TALEGLTFQTPKGPMTFRREDHQALQDMYHFRIRPNARDNDLLDLVATIPAADMPLPITNRRYHPHAERLETAHTSSPASRAAAREGDPGAK